MFFGQKLLDRKKQPDFYLIFPNKTTSVVKKFPKNNLITLLKWRMKPVLYESRIQ